jgi:PIN domain nuclease of toxin-antitoxin system
VKFLLDTHVLLWWLRDEADLASRTKAVLADPDTQLLASVASFWEISIKWRRGQIDISGTDLHSEAVAEGIPVVNFAFPHLAALEQLEFLPGHKDPFDHLILAQAIAEEAVLVTADRRMLDYDIRKLRAK